MKYVIETLKGKQSSQTGYIVWEEEDYPSRELLKHSVPQNYVGTSKSKYLLELFELSWNDGTYIPEGYIPLYNRLPFSENSKIEYEITSFGSLDYATATKLIFKSTFGRFGINYYDTCLGESVFEGLDKMSIPFLAHKGIIPENVDSIYYFALMFRHKIFNNVSFSGISEILRNSEKKHYPKDENGFLDLDSLKSFSEIFKETNWSISPNRHETEDKWNPYIVSPTHWVEFYEMYIKYGSEGFIDLSNNLELNHIKRVIKIAEMFEIENAKELIEVHKTVPEEWLKNFSPIMDEPPF